MRVWAASLNVNVSVRCLLDSGHEFSSVEELELIVALHEL